MEIWPRPALEAVATRIIPHLVQGQTAAAWAVPRTLAAFHLDANSAVAAAAASSGRRAHGVLSWYCGTPRAFSCFVGSFVSLVEQRRSRISHEQARYGMGLEQLQQAAQAIADLEALVAMKRPVLERTSAEAARLMAAVETKLPLVLKKESEVMADAEMAEGDRADCSKLKAECEAQLAVALPALSKPNADSRF